MGTLHRLLRTNEIRLLKLLDSSVSCFEFVYASIDDPPRYAALSYTWGDVKGSESIIIDGHSVEITCNLSDALHTLSTRMGISGLLLWVDAVCINQDNLEERSSQVNIMTEIFQKGQNVWIWLGNASSESDIAMRAIRDFGTFFYDHEAEISTMPHGADSGISPTNPRIYGSAGSPRMQSWHYIRDLLRRPWWSRTWVVQEATCPVPTTLFCGSSYVEWGYLYGTARLMVALDVFQEVDFDVNITLASFVWLSTIRTARLEKKEAVLKLNELVALTSGMACRDPRDRIFALVGIASDIVPGSLVPDYTKSVEEVYKDFVNFCRATSLPGHELDFLGTLDIQPRDGSKEPSGTNASKTPSWMPSWQPHGQVDPFAKSFQGRSGRVYCADGNSISNIFLHEFKLHVKGFSFDRIETLTNLFAYKNDPILEARWFHSLPLTDLYHNGQSLREAARHTLCSDVKRNGGQVVTRNNQVDFSYEVIPSTHLNAAGLRAKQKIRMSIKSSTFGRKIMRTVNGSIGLAPGSGQVDDKICVLYGGSVPYVLREQRSNCYTLIGECYVHGFMDGEAMKFLHSGEPKEETFVIV